MFFDADYEVLLADNGFSKNIHYQIRYQVYCQETGFENPQNYVEPLEVDEYDSSSVHFVARDKVSGDWLGAIRLVIGEVESMPSFQSLSDKYLDKVKIFDSVEKFRSTKVVEISRLCVLKKYRTHIKSEKNCNVSGSDVVRSPDTVIEYVDKGQQSEIMMGLLRAAYTYCVKNKLDICLFTVTKALARILSRLGFSIIKSGKECEYHGTRVSFFCEIENFLSGVEDISPDLYQMFIRPEAYKRFSCLNTQINVESSGKIRHFPPLLKQIA